MENEFFNASKENMFDLMKLSISLIETDMTKNLDHLKLVVPTEWYKTIRNKIQKQEMKAAKSFIAKKMCDIGFCEEVTMYSDYMKIWLGFLLNLKPKSLHEFFIFILDAMEKHKYFIKTNVKFRKTIKSIRNSDIVAQRDCLDFMHEILVNLNVLNAVPDHTKEVAMILIEIFRIIDYNYFITEENNKELKRITENLGKVLDKKYVFVPLLLDQILENFKLNLKIWPLKVQLKLNNLWEDIIQL